MKIILNMLNKCLIIIYIIFLLKLNFINLIRNHSIIKEKFLRYVKCSDGKVIPGLVNRRSAEAELFCRKNLNVIIGKNMIK